MVGLGRRDACGFGFLLRRPRLCFWPVKVPRLLRSSRRLDSPCPLTRRHEGFEYLGATLVSSTAKGGSKARKRPDFVDENPQTLDGKPEDILEEFVHSDLQNPGSACLYRRPTPGLMDIFGAFALLTQCSMSVLKEGKWLRIDLRSDSPAADDRRRLPRAPVQSRLVKD